MKHLLKKASFWLSLFLIMLVAGCSTILNPFRMAATVTVVDDQGNPVAGAEAGAVAYSRGFTTMSECSYDEGVTNRKGIVHLAQSGDSSMGLTVVAKKDGYYGGGKIIYPPLSLMFRSEETKLVLRKKQNPVPMYVKNMTTSNCCGGPEYLTIPHADETFGFDFEKGELVAPYGKGVRADVFIKVTGYFKNEEDFSYTMTMTFPNPHDGIIVTDISEYAFSNLHSPLVAPEDGYKPSFSMEDYRQKHLGRFNIGNTDEEAKQLFIFRVRSVIDSNGKLVKACYGKIYKSIKFDGRPNEFLVFMKYYFNPDPNSRSLEFNGKNLFKEDKDHYAP